MNLIDLYVTEVGRHLPKKMREDIEREIRSLLMDALDDASQQQSREPDDEMAAEVLRKYGPPAKVAASYQPPRYLIGPNLFPTFLMVVQIVLSVIVVVAAIGIGVDLGRTTAGWEAVLETIGKGLLGLLGSAMSAFGNIVLVFAIFQWLTPNVKFDESTWDPRQLKAEPDPDQVKPAGVAVDIILTLVLLLVLNFYPHWIGISSLVGGQWLHAPMLAQAFFQYMPWINLVLIGGIVTNGLLIRRRFWTPFLRWLSMGVQLASIMLLAWILAGPSIVSMSTSQLAQAGWDPAVANGFEQAAPVFSLLIRMALGIALITQVIDLVKKLYRQVVPKLSLPARHAH